MAHIEALVKPIAVLPDLDGDSNAYFALKDRTNWRDDFVNWLEEPLTQCIHGLPDQDMEIDLCGLYTVDHFSD